MEAPAFGRRDACILAAVRTPLGSFGGVLSSLSAAKLGAVAIKGAVEKAGIPVTDVEEVFMGQVVTANCGQNPARQAAIFAGMPNSVPGVTLNKVCASGLKAVMLAAQSVMAGVHHVVVAGGMEAMSQAPYYIPSARFGARMGHTEMIDGAIKDGLWDVYNDIHMGECGEICADKYALTREQQDDYAIQSYERAINAKEIHRREIVPVSIVDSRKKSEIVIDSDEEPTKFNPSKMRTLRAAFRKDGTITAANAPALSDGAAALIVVSGEYAVKKGLSPIAVIKGFADAAQEAEMFTVSPSLAIPKALGMAGWNIDSVDLFEINEAFSAVALANSQILNLTIDKVNVHGGAVALGHPIGCSGARILVTLLTALQDRRCKKGIAGICNGGGGASALAVELV